MLTKQPAWAFWICRNWVHYGYRWCCKVHDARGCDIILLPRSLKTCCFAFFSKLTITPWPLSWTVLYYSSLYLIYHNFVTGLRRLIRRSNYSVHSSMYGNSDWILLCKAMIIIILHWIENKMRLQIDSQMSECDFVLLIPDPLSSFDFLF